MPLTVEQEEAINEVLAGKSIFLTGPGGVGKSHLIRELKVRTLLAGKTIAVTAMTGCAALQLECGAKTLHSWAGIGLGKEPVETLVTVLKRFNNKKAQTRWKLTDILVIDEVSMMTPDLLEKLDVIGRVLRKNDFAPIFNVKGRRISTRAVRYVCQRISAYASSNLAVDEKIHLSPHMLRHTFLKRIADKHGVHIAQKMSGNVSISEIFRYTKPSQDEIDKIAEELNP